jgi:hypothetical protein
MPANFLPTGSNSNPHPYPWAQDQTCILALAGFYPWARGYFVLVAIPGQIIDILSISQFSVYDQKIISFFCMNSDGGKRYMKIVAFDEIYNFVVQSFSI